MSSESTCATFLTLLLIVGCGPAVETDDALSEVEASANRSVVNQGDRDSDLPVTDKREAWEVYCIGNTIVGHGQIVFASLQQEGQPLFRVSSTSEMNFQRFGQTVSQKVALDSVETAEGRLLRFESREFKDSTTLETKGRYVDGQLVIETNTLGKTQSKSIPWNEKFGGPFADQLSLRCQPMQPGERRHLTALVPMLNIPGQIEMVAQDTERTNLLDGERSLLRIESTLKVGPTTTESVYWTDEQGEVLKTLATTGFELFTYRTTRDEALNAVGSARFNLE